MEEASFRQRGINTVGTMHLNVCFLSWYKARLVFTCFQSLCLARLTMLSFKLWTFYLFKVLERNQVSVFH